MNTFWDTPYWLPDNDYIYLGKERQHVAKVVYLFGLINFGEGGKPKFSGELHDK